MLKTIIRHAYFWAFGLEHGPKGPLKVIWHVQNLDQILR